MGRVSAQRRSDSNTKTTVVGFALLAAVLLVPAAHAQETLVDRIIATVNREPIMYSEVQEKVKKGHLVAVSEYPAEDSASDFEKAMQDSINLELIKQKAAELEIDVSEQEVDQEIQRFLESRQLNMEGLRDALRGQGMTFDEYKADFKDQIVLRRFQGHVISPLIKVTDKDIETYYLKKSGTSSESVRLILRQILIKIPDGAAAEVEEGKLNLARSVHQKLSSGMAFEEAVKIFSDDAGARSKGGLMAEVALKDLSSAIRTEVENLEVGKFTSPIKVGNNYHIFYLDKKKFSGSDDFVKQKRQLEFELKNVELIAQTKKWLADQRRKSKVNVLN